MFSEVPDVLSYLSYLFHFQTVLTGPLSFYADYDKFINGNDLSEHERKVRFLNFESQLEILLLDNECLESRLSA
jgi:hypothetical protein